MGEIKEGTNKTKVVEMKPVVQPEPQVQEQSKQREYTKEELIDIINQLTMQNNQMQQQLQAYHNDRSMMNLGILFEIVKEREAFDEKYVDLAVREITSVMFKTTKEEEEL